MTRYGVEYDLKLSPFQYTTERFIFFFSSVRYLEKMCEEIEAKEANKCCGIISELNFEIEALDILIYRAIEKRGFCVKEKKSGKYIDKFVFNVRAEVE